MATIKDVARLAGVGLGTASRVVSGKGSVSPATLERVKKAIDELGFRPSHAARALLSGSSRMIGVYIPVLSGTFYTPILQIIDTELRAALDALPTKQRGAVIYHYLAGLPYAEVGSILETSEAAARRSAADGIANLRKTYKKGKS